MFTSSLSNYFALLRVGYSTTNILSQVTSDPTQTNQTTLHLGTFSIPNQIRKSNFSYIPLLDSNGWAHSELIRHQHAPADDVRDRR